MAAIALTGGVAKATLYNHFRTKQDVWSALVDREVRRVFAIASLSIAPAERLDRAAAEVGALAAVRALAVNEPAALVPLLAPGDSPEWDNARGAIAGLLGCSPDEASVDLVLRWLCSQLLAPQLAEKRMAAARILSLIGASVS